MKDFRAATRLLRDLIKSQAIDRDALASLSCKSVRSCITLENALLNPCGIAALGTVLYEHVLAMFKPFPTYVGSPTGSARMLVTAFLREHYERDFTNLSSEVDSPILPTKGFYVHKESAKYPAGSRIIGHIGYDASVVFFVDGLTENAVGYAVQVVTSPQYCTAKLRGVVALIDCLDGTAERFTSAHIPYSSIFTLTDFGLAEKSKRRS